ncbi:MAG: cupin domain-containing protein [Proteobacteria bacterium]|nr:cupin domain-containing protein [Pseudomonadota bacterium]
MTQPRLLAPRPLADEWLVDYAAGSAPEPVAALLEAHLSLCPAARATLARLDAVGGALLERIEPAALSEDALDAMLARLDAPAPVLARAPKPEAHPILPAALIPYVGRDIETLGWKTVVRGVDEVALPAGGPATHRMSLMRIAAGRAVPAHTHYGDELLLVLQGSFEDGHGHYARGDVCASDETVEHAPKADRGMDCLCLAVTTGPVKLTTGWGRLINPLLRLARR